MFFGQFPYFFNKPSPETYITILVDFPPFPIRDGILSLFFFEGKLRVMLPSSSSSLGGTLNRAPPFFGLVNQQ